MVKACRDLADAGQTIVLVEQNLAATLALAKPRLHHQQRAHRARRDGAGDQGAAANIAPAPWLLGAAYSKKGQHLAGASDRDVQAVAASASIKSEMPTYFAACVTSGSWSANPTSQSKLVTAISEYFTAGIAVHFLKNFNMTLHSAAPPARGTMITAVQYSLLRCKMANRIRTELSRQRAGAAKFPKNKAKWPPEWWPVSMP